MKLFASYGKFFGHHESNSLPQGFLRWPVTGMTAAYQLNDPDIRKHSACGAPLPGRAFSAPQSGPAAGSFSTNTFIENINYRSVILFPTDPGVDPNLKTVTAAPK